MATSTYSQRAAVVVIAIASFPRTWGQTTATPDDEAEKAASSNLSTTSVIFWAALAIVLIAIVVLSFCVVKNYMHRDDEPISNKDTDVSTPKSGDEIAYASSVYAPQQLLDSVASETARQAGSKAFDDDGYIIIDVPTDASFKPNATTHVQNPIFENDVRIDVHPLTATGPALSMSAMMTGSLLEDRYERQNVSEFARDSTSKEAKFGWDGLEVDDPSLFNPAEISTKSIPAPSHEMSGIYIGGADAWNQGPHESGENLVRLEAEYGFGVEESMHRDETVENEPESPIQLYEASQKIVLDSKSELFLYKLPPKKDPSRRANTNTPIELPAYDIPPPYRPDKDLLPSDANQKELVPAKAEDSNRPSLPLYENAPAYDEEDGDDDGSGDDIAKRNIPSAWRVLGLCQIGTNQETRQADKLPYIDPPTYSSSGDDDDGNIDHDQNETFMPPDILYTYPPEFDVDADDEAEDSRRRAYLNTLLVSETVEQSIAYIQPPNYRDELDDKVEEDPLTSCEYIFPPVDQTVEVEHEMDYADPPDFDLPEDSCAESDDDAIDIPPRVDSDESIYGSPILAYPTGGDTSEAKGDLYEDSDEGSDLYEVPEVENRIVDTASEDDVDDSYFEDPSISGHNFAPVYCDDDDGEEEDEYSKDYTNLTLTSAQKIPEAYAIAPKFVDEEDDYTDLVDIDAILESVVPEYIYHEAPAFSDEDDDDSTDILEEDTSPTISPEVIRGLKALFEGADEGAYVGILNSVELQHRLPLNKVQLVLESAGLMPYFDSDNDGKLSLDELLAAADTNRDGMISLQEFTSLAMQKIKSRNKSGTISSTTPHTKYTTKPKVDSVLPKPNPTRSESPKPNPTRSESPKPNPTRSESPKPNLTPPELKDPEISLIDDSHQGHANSTSPLSELEDPEAVSEEESESDDENDSYDKLGRLPLIKLLKRREVDFSGCTSVDDLRERARETDPEWDQYSGMKKKKIIRLLQERRVSHEFCSSVEELRERARQTGPIDDSYGKMRRGQLIDILDEREVGHPAGASVPELRHIARTSDPKWDKFSGMNSAQLAIFLNSQNVDHLACQNIDDLRACARKVDQQIQSGLAPNSSNKVPQPVLPEDDKSVVSDATSDGVYLESEEKWNANQESLKKKAESIDTYEVIIPQPSPRVQRAMKMINIGAEQLSSSAHRKAPIEIDPVDSSDSDTVPGDAEIDEYYEVPTLHVSEDVSKSASLAAQGPIHGGADHSETEMDEYYEVPDLKKAITKSEDSNSELRGLYDNSEANTVQTSATVIMTRNSGERWGLQIKPHDGRYAIVGISAGAAASCADELPIGALVLSVNGNDTASLTKALLKKIVTDPGLLKIELVIQSS